MQLRDRLRPTRRRAGLFAGMVVVFVLTAGAALSSPWTTVPFHLPYLLVHVDAVWSSRGDVVTAADVALSVLIVALNLVYLWVWAVGVDGLWDRAGEA